MAVDGAKVVGIAAIQGHGIGRGAGRARGVREALAGDRVLDDGGERVVFALALAAAQLEGGLAAAEARQREEGDAQEQPGASSTNMAVHSGLIGCVVMTDDERTRWKQTFATWGEVDSICLLGYPMGVDDGKMLRTALS